MQLLPPVRTAVSMSSSDDIRELKDAIRRLHGVESKHFGAIPVTETLPGGALRDQVVELFQLYGHARAFNAFAWAEETETGQKRCVVVLQIHPIVSVQDAVRSVMTPENMGTALHTEPKSICHHAPRART